MNPQTEIKRLLEGSGFGVVREGKHVIWSDGVSRIVTSRSPSCARAIDNIRGEIKRALKKREKEMPVVTRKKVNIATAPVPRVVQQTSVPENGVRSETVTVFSTKDYALFQFLAENRAVSPAHVKELEKAMVEHGGFRRDSAIKVIRVGPDKYGIIDGQHRYLAAKGLDIDLYFAVVDDADFQKALDGVRDSHATFRGWRSDEFIEHYAKRGFPVYVRIRDFSERYQLPFPVATALLSANYGGGGGGSARLRADVKTGRFTIDPRLAAKAEEFARMITEIVNVHERIGRQRKQSSFATACMKLVTHENYDHGRMLYALNEYLAMFIKCRTSHEYLRMFQTIFNHCRKSGYRTEFVAE